MLACRSKSTLASLALGGLAMAALAAPAQASDCSDPEDPVQKAVCATPGGRRADDAMGDALARSGRADLMSRDRRDLFIADQGAWLARRGLAAKSATPASVEQGMLRRVDQLLSCYPQPDETMARRLGVRCVAYVAPKCPSVYLEVEPRILHLTSTMAPALQTLSLDAAEPACQRLNFPVASKPRHSISMAVTGERRGVFFTRTVETRPGHVSVSADAWDASTGRAVPWDAVLTGVAPGTTGWARMMSASNGMAEDMDGMMRDLRSLGVDLTTPPQGWHVSSGGDLMLEYARSRPDRQGYVSVEVPKPLFARFVSAAWTHVFVPAPHR